MLSLRRLILLLCLSFISQISLGQNLEFVHVSGPRNMCMFNESVSKAVATDASGNMYVTGYYQDTVDFDPGPGVVQRIAPFNTRTAFVLKLDALGNFAWVDTFRNTGYTDGRAITVDGSGNVYVTGRFESTVDFDPGPGVTNLSVVNGKDVFVLKLDNSGGLIWATKASSAFNQASDVSSIAVDASGNVFVPMHNGNSTTFYKFNSLGTMQWEKSFGSTSSSFPVCKVALDAVGDPYLAGSFLGTADFDASGSVFNMTSTPTFTSGYVLKMTTAGNFVWAKQFTGTSDVVNHDIALDASGNIYLTGYYRGGTTDFNPDAGTFNLTTSALTFSTHVVKLNSSGNFIWAKDFNSTSVTIGWGIAINSGNVYVTGYTTGSVDFDPSASTYNLCSCNRSLFLAKLNSSGNFNWAKITVGGLISEGTEIAITSDAKILVPTYAAFNTDFDFTSGVNTPYTAGCAGWGVAKYDTVNVSAAPELSSPVATVTIASNDADNLVCSNQMITFTATYTFGGSPTFEWKKNGTTVSSGPSSSYTVNSNTMTNGDVFTCDMTSNCSCVASPIVTSNSITITIVSNAFTVSIVSDDVDNKICTGTNVTFTPTPTNGGTVQTYFWFVNGSNMGSSPTYTTNSLVDGDVVKCVMQCNVTCPAYNFIYSNDITFTVIPTTGQEIDVMGGPLSIVNGDNTPDISDDTEFGAVNVLSGTEVRTFTIKNTGTDPLIINSVSITGVNASEFTLTALTFPFTIATGSSLNAIITFDPASVGTKNATLNIENTDCDEGTYSFDLQGTGIAGVIPTTQLLASSCGKILNNNSDRLYFKSISGATGYEVTFVSVTNPTLTFVKTISNTSNSFEIGGFTPLLVLGENYTVKLKVITALGTSAFGPSCNVLFSNEIKQVNIFCGKTYTNLNNAFAVFKKDNVINYKFEFTDILTNVKSTIIKPQTPPGSYGQITINLDEINSPSLFYERTYKVEVFAEYIDITGTNVYGTVFPACQIFIDKASQNPVAGYCGNTFTNLGEKFVTFPVADAIDYTFTFTDVISGTVSTVVKPQPAPTAYQQVSIALSDLSPALNYNRNYNVTVTPKYLNVLGATVFGNPLICSVSISKPVVPSASAYCPRTYPSLTGVFSVFRIPNVINYKFIFTEIAAPFNVKEIIFPQTLGSYGLIVFNINNSTLGLQMNKTYDVDVYAEYFDVTAGTNLYGNVFSNCQITIGVPSKKGDYDQELNSFTNLTIYPNPSSGLVTLANSQNFENATVKIFNSLGQIVFNKDNISGNDINIDFSNQTSGMYILEINQNNEFSRIKLIKE